MNRNIAAVRPLKNCASMNVESGTRSPVVHQANLLADDESLVLQQRAPAGNLRTLEARLRHCDGDGGNDRSRLAIADGNADAAQVRHELLDVDRKSLGADLLDVAPQ